MSRFNDLCYALDYLQRPELRTVANNLSDYVDNLITPYLNKEGYPKAINSLMNLRICHALLKNRGWCHSTQFQALIQRDLADFFGVNQEFCNKLIKLVAGELSELLQNSNRYDGNRYFEYLFVKIATSTDINKLTQELGLDRQIIKRIKQSAQRVFSRQNQQNTDEIQLAITDIVLRYAKKMKSIPWALDVARLEFALPDSAFDWSLFRSELGRHILFNTLMHLSENQRVKGCDLAVVFMEQVQQFSDGQEWPELPDEESLLKLMCNANLIYPETARKTMRASFFCLAEMGFEITANAYAYENKLDIEQNPYRLLEVEEPYQVHLLRLMTKEGLLNLAAVLDKDYALSRGAIKIFAERMLFINENQRLFAILSQWMTEHPSYWIREAAVAATVHLDKTDTIRLCLQDVAKSDPSCAVQNKAIELLMQD